MEFADLLEAVTPDNSLKGTSVEQMGEPGGKRQEGTEAQPLNNDPNLAVQNLLQAMTQYTSQGDVTYSETVEGEDGEETVQTVAFSQFILEALQEIRAGIHIGKVDTSNFPEISVTVNLSWQKENQERYQKEDFHVTEQGTEISDFELVDTSQEDAKPQVCLVVDHSGSMAGYNLEQAQRAVTSFIQTAGSGISTGLVQFDDTAQILCPVTESTGVVQRSVDAIEAAGGTNISQGLLKGMEALEDRSGNRIIILLSDGADSSESSAAMPSVINQLTQKGIVVYAVGFDFADSGYLSQICEATGGKFLRSETSEDLGSVYQTIEKFLTQDYVIRFTVQEDTSIYNREIRVSLDDGVFDETEYFAAYRRRESKKKQICRPSRISSSRQAAPVRRRMNREKRSLFAGNGVCVLGFLVLLVAFYAMYMNSGTRLLYENSVWGARWRSYPWVFLAAAVVLAVGGVLMKVGYVPKAKRPKKVHPTVVPKMPAVESYTGSVDEREPVSASTAEPVNAPKAQSAEPVVPVQGYAGFTLQFGAEEPSSSDRKEVPAQKGTEASAPAAHTSFDLCRRPLGILRKRLRRLYWVLKAFPWGGLQKSFLHLFRKTFLCRRQQKLLLLPPYIRGLIWGAPLRGFRKQWKCPRGLKVYSSVAAQGVVPLTPTEDLIS